MNMSKIKEKYSAEIIILLIFSLALLSSCKTNKQEPINCCQKDTKHPLWECEGELVYKHSELITN